MASERRATPNDESISAYAAVLGGLGHPRRRI